MKKTLEDISAKEFLYRRFDKLTEKNKAQWGKMNVKQMLRHINIATNLATGKTPANRKPKFIERTLLKSLILWGMPAPKGKVQTTAELDTVMNKIEPADLNEERNSLKQTMEEFLLFGVKNEYHPHPAFGKMNGKQWKRLVYLHTDHHLKQFGV